MRQTLWVEEESEARLMFVMMVFLMHSRLGLVPCSLLPLSAAYLSPSKPSLKEARVEGLRLKPCSRYLPQERRRLCVPAKHSGTIKQFGKHQQRICFLILKFKKMYICWKTSTHLPRFVVLLLSVSSQRTPRGSRPFTLIFPTASARIKLHTNVRGGNRVRKACVSRPSVIRDRNVRQSGNLINIDPDGITHPLLLIHLKVGIDFLQLHH